VVAFLMATLTASGAAASEDDLRAEVDLLRQQVAELKELLGARIGKDVATTDVAAKGLRPSFGGQYRINSYSADNDGAADRQTASRVRIRQNVDLHFDERFKTHLQLELGHTTDNVTTTNNSSRATNIAVRHAVIDYTFDKGANFQAGIVPLSDRFGDTLFSADWDYNPVALSVTTPLLGGTLRAFAANLDEGIETDADDDFVHYQLDYAIPFADQHQLNLGGTLASIADPSGKNRLHANYGIGASFRLTDDLLLRGFLVGSHTQRQLLSTSDHADGYAAKIELSSESGFGLMATYASGDSDGNGFLPTMALATTNGYWGYTGILTVQGPTDTGFDGDSVNISNNGFGLTTVQAKYARPMTTDFDLYLAAGWFGNTDSPSGRDSLVGIDALAMGTYHFNEILALDFGVAYARLRDSVSGYSNGVIGGTSFNQAIGEERNKYAFFSRLQAEF
jgi:hypothetical protein